MILFLIVGQNPTTSHNLPLKDMKRDATVVFIPEKKKKKKNLFLKDMKRDVS